MNLKDLDGRYLLTNRTFERLRGGGSYLGQTYAEAGGGNDVSHIDDADRKVMDTGEIQNGEAYIRYPNGEAWHRRFTKFPVFDADGELMGVGGIGTNTIEQKRTEERLRTSEALLRAIVDNSPYPISLKYTDGRFVVVNKAFERMFGFSAERVIGQTADIILDPQHVVQMAAHDRFVIEMGETRSEERSQRLQHGGVLHNIVTKFPVKDENGNVELVGTIMTDISGLKRIEEALRESEARLRAIIDSSPMPISLKDLNHNFVSVNKSFENAIGVRASDVLGRTASVYMQEDHFEAVTAQEKRVLDSGETCSEERVARLSNGRLVQNIVTKFPIRNADGEVALVGTIMTDITKRKAAEAALRNSEAQLRLIIDSLPIGIGYFSTDERYVLANKTSAEWFGTTPTALVGKRIETVQEDTYPSFRHWVEETLAGNEISFEASATYPDGVTRDVQITHVPEIGPDGDVRGFFGMAQDITERKQAERERRDAEERFRAVIDNSPTAIVLKDSNDRYLLVNKTFREWLALPDDEIILGKSTYDFFPEETANQIVAHDALVKVGRTPEVRERESTFPDGVTRRTWVHKFPIFGPDGECTAIGTVNVDVTEQRGLQAQLSQAQKMEAIGKLTGGIAHDFNNLLGVIIGNLDFLAEELPDKHDLMALVERAMRAALNGARLTRQLLAFSRNQPLLPLPVDLNEQICKLKPMLQSALGEIVDIRTDLESTPQKTKVDTAQLESVLLNLALNARDAMSDGGDLVIRTRRVYLDEGYIAAKADLTAGDYVMLSVQDTGTGMSQDILAQVFDPFFTTKEVGEGSGLGLSMVFGFTKQSGGHVEIESEVGRGTTVKLFLPYLAEDIETAAPVAQDAPKAQGECVLVVEDDPGLLKLAVSLLRSLDYTVCEAANGQEALKVLEAEPAVDLVLSDVVMPGGLSGLALTARLKATHPETKVLLMSGYTEDSLEAADPGAPMLRKPFRKAQLATMLRQVLDS